MDYTPLQREVAWMVEPVDYFDATTEIARALHCPVSHIKQGLKDAAARGELISEKADRTLRRTFRLAADQQLDILEQIGHEEGRRKRAEQTDLANHGYWTKAVRLFVTGSDGYTRLSPYIDWGNHIPMLVAMARRKAWEPFTSLLPEDIVVKMYDEMMRPALDDLLPLPDIILPPVSLSHTSGRYIEGKYVFYHHAWSADISSANNTGKDPYSLAAQALALQYEGKDAEAIALYQKANTKRLKVCFGDPFIDFFYMLALTWIDDETSRKQLQSIHDKQYEYLYDYLCLQLLCFKSNPHDTKIIINQLDLTPWSRLDRILSLLVIHHFRLPGYENVDYTPLKADLSASACQLLRAEAAVDFGGDSIEGLTPILSRVRIMEKWEKVLVALQRGADAPPKEVQPQAQSRIIYLVDEFLNVEPRLQRSKDGTIWTAGRALALRHLYNGDAEGMDDQDRLVAKTIQKYTEYWGGAPTYSLTGVKTIASLAGCNRVYASKSRASQIVITREEPHISITRTSRGLTIEHNLHAADKAGNICLVKETPLLYHVYHLTDEQLALVALLDEAHTFPPEAEQRLTALLPHLSRTITVHSDLLPASADIRRTEPVSDIVVQLMPFDQGLTAELYVKPLGDIPPYCRPAEGNATVIGHDGNTQIQTQRDFDSESERLREATELLAPFSDCLDDDNVYHTATSERSLELLDLLRQHVDRLHTEWPQGERWRIAATAKMDDLHISVVGLKGWFGLEGQLRTSDGQVHAMADILGRLHEAGTSRFIQLTDGTFLAISKNLRRQLQTLDGMTTDRRGQLVLPPMAAGLLDGVAESGASLTSCPAFDAMKQRIAQAEAGRYGVPHGLNAQLRPYQVDGYKWMARLAAWGAGACLADDMGLGKTIQTIALLLQRAREGASLVVAPSSVAPNWRAEILRFAPSLTPRIVNEADDRQKAVNEAEAFDVVIVTYGLLIREGETLAARRWNVVVLDEAHTIKNKETKMSPAAMQLDGDARVLLTGTPLQNHLAEIWNLFQFANPGLLGSYQQFGTKFVTPIERDHDKQRQTQLKRLLAPFILRRTKTEVLDELPEKTEITLRVELSPAEHTLYEALRRTTETALADGSITTMQALAEISRLRMAACHPRLVDKAIGIPSSKTEAFMQLVQDLTTLRHRALVFSQFTSHLALVRERLDAAHIEYLYLDGSTPLAERTRLVKAFQTGTQPLFLISLKAGGLGLNLTAADYVIHLDPWWNPAIEDQASDRAYRIGQQRPVTIYRLIAADTIEEKILRLHATKKTLADALLEGSDMAHAMGRDEILALLSEQ